ncbi:dentin sialophosphoprotein [Sitodiplosis mosellana]|uniref:dentin sialophosphoprotein n=1 Tax=Sitodiplosis mosellana TaxID=263140 RepID=UPI002443FB4E|nr:dentin sialophosphoprotein [Sitodiplosis mosellana]XP_055311010.1 dentin sialophosphoprotein [Sitodiplosis mosellana]XP_055311011.1 dentin sialophosphoprotein [Sitodiplosis mosellana]
MNHRTHSGSSPTVITNPNAFDSSNSVTKNRISTAFPANKNNHQRLNAPKSANSSDRSSGTNKNPLKIDFDALESIPFDDVTTDDTYPDAIIGSTTNPNNHDSNAHISAVFKKLTTYFSQSSHKTLTNLKINNNRTSSSRKCNLTNKPRLGDHKFSCNQNSTDNCAVFENCNTIASLPVSLNRSECSRDDTSSLPSDKQTPFVTTTLHTKKSTNLHHSSDRISVSNKISVSANAMCRADDSYALDGRNMTIATSTMPSSNTQSTNNRTKNLKTTIDGLQTGETFSLPRVILRQSFASPTASNGNPRKNVSSSKRSNPSIVDRSRRRHSFGEQEQVPASHYSTEKSGSSGYYSSNVYSTSSVEDHIYSEPVINDITDSNRRRKFDQKLDQQIGLANLEKSIKTLEKHLKCLNKTNNKAVPTGEQPQKTQEPIQESTPKTNGSVDEPTKRLPTIVEGMDNNALGLVSYGRTDIETKRRSDWNANTNDDSFMDLDLDTFLLIDETRDKKNKSSFSQTRGEGIENPTFQSDNEHEHDQADSGQEVDDDDDDDRNSDNDDNGGDGDEDGHSHTDNGGDNCKTTARNSDENNYKCTKYINSCPDDAYNVDEITDYKYEQHHFHSFLNNKLMPFYMRNIEDQLNHQNTKDILEEIREKLAVLMKPSSDSEHESSAESDGISSSKSNSKTVSLMRNITALKLDVDNYLVMMNQQNELEIRAFCSGLSKNYKLLTMQHALDNRTRRPKLSTSDIGSEVYSNSNINSNSNSSSSSHHHQSQDRRRRRLKNQMKRNQGTKNQMRTWKNQSKILLNTYENDSIRCSSSDSNFQLQRRHSDSICSSWEDSQQIMTTSSSGRGSSGSAHSDNSIGNEVIIPIEVETLLNTSNRDATRLSTPVSNDASESSTSIELSTSIESTSVSVSVPSSNGHIENNLAMQQPSLVVVDNAKDVTNDEKDIMLEWHRNKPSIWQQYYGSKRLKYSNMVKKIKGKFDVNTAVMSYPSTRPETDFTLDVPRAEQLRIKMQQEKKFRCRCRFMLAFFSLAFFLMTVVIFSLMLSRGKRMFGSMVTL